MITVMNIQKLIAAFLGVLLFFGTVFLAKVGAPIFIPFIFALLLSFVFGPFLARMNKVKIPYGLGIVTVLIVFFIGCFILGFFLYSSVNAVAREIPKYYFKMETLTFQLFDWINLRFDIDLTTQMADINWLNTVRPVLLGFSGGFIGFLKNLGIVILFLVFLLIETPYFQKTIERAFPRKTSFRIIRVFKHTIRQISQYLGLKFLISAATGLFVWLLLMIIGLDFASLWGVLAFVFNFIPSIGSFFIMAGTILMGFLQFYPDPGKIVAVAVSMVLVQVILGNFLDPKLQGERLRLSPLIILFSLFIFGYIWGIAGMFLAVPMLSVVKILCENIPGLEPFAVVLENGRGHGMGARNRKHRIKKKVTLLGPRPTLGKAASAAPEAGPASGFSPPSGPGNDGAAAPPSDTRSADPSA